MTPTVRIDAGIPPENEEPVAEVYLDDQCLMVVSQESGFDSLDVEMLARNDGNLWRIKYDLLLSLLSQAKDRLWRLRRVPADQLRDHDRELVLDAVDGAFNEFVWYGRKLDKSLPQDKLCALVRDGVVSKAEIVARFKHLIDGWDVSEPPGTAANP